MGILNLMPKEKPKTQQLSQVDFNQLLNHFVTVQKTHQEARKKALYNIKATKVLNSPVHKEPSRDTLKSGNQ